MLQRATRSQSKIDRKKQQTTLPNRSIGIKVQTVNDFVAVLRQTGLVSELVYIFLKFFVKMVLNERIKINGTMRIRVFAEVENIRCEIVAKLKD